MNPLKVSEYDPNVVKSCLLPLYESVYRFEIERKDAINSRLSFPIAILTLLLGAITFLIKDLPNFENNIYCFFFYFFAFLLVISFLYSIYLFVRSLFGYRYAYLRPLGTIDKVVRDLKKYNEKVKADKKADIKNELSVFLLEQYCESSDINRDLNKKKTGYFRRTLKALVASALFLFLALMPFMFLKYSRTEQKTQNIAVKDFQFKKPVVIKIEDDEIKGLINAVTIHLDKTNKERSQKMSNGDEKKPETDEKPERPEWPNGPERIEESDVSESERIEKRED